MYEGNSNINGNFSRSQESNDSAVWLEDMKIGISRVDFVSGALVDRARQSIVSSKISEQEVHLYIAQHIIVKFLTKKGVKSAKILRILRAQFDWQVRRGGDRL